MYFLQLRGEHRSGNGGAVSSPNPSVKACIPLQGKERRFEKINVYFLAEVITFRCSEFKRYEGEEVRGPLLWPLLCSYILLLG